ncbi:MAG: PEP-CTERM sorting domain-containing protein [Gammaproteobacteria bacterium]|nr:PEP-CTERM sorting domain-containing protein [Gammaproteobacteria bacterium]
MGWTEDGSILLDPVTGVGPDITVSFWASTDYGTTETATGLGWSWGSGTVDPTVVISFSENVKNVVLDIGDLDTFEALINMTPVPDAVSDSLYISGDSVFASISDMPSTIFYGLNSTLSSFEFTFDQTASNLGLSNLRFESVPEPGALLLIGIGLVGIGARKRMKKRGSQHAC